MELFGLKRTHGLAFVSIMPHSSLSLRVAGRILPGGGWPLRAGTGDFSDLMASNAARVDALLVHDRFRRSEALALGFGAIAVALGAAAWIADTGSGSFAAAALPGNPQLSSFEDRFSPLSSSAASGSAASEDDDAVVAAQDRFASATLELQLQGARGELGRGLTSGRWRAALVERAAPSAESAQVVEAPAASSSQLGIPMPRSRPAGANTQAAAAPADTAPKPEDRSILQKLTDLLPSGRIRLASLTPDSGLFSQGPDLAALGYDRQTAVYDITAHAVYLPGGVSLEAHSGMGDLRDSPDHVQQRMVGATPPATYELKPREKLFHGVAALRMNPVDGANIFGRAGLLAHSYMLGPNGDSNGCISIKNYDRFLKAYNDGEINRIVVVPALSGATQARASSES
jgi:hypothetical protein